MNASTSARMNPIISRRIRLGALGSAGGIAASMMRKRSPDLSVSMLSDTCASPYRVSSEL